MAERIQVELVDDIDGSPAQHTVTFALDGVSYEIDLSERHAKQLRSVLSRYIERARKASERAARGNTREQEREERQTRQANRQLTEQIRGAAARTREHLKAKEETPQDESVAQSAEEPAEESVLPEAPNAGPETTPEGEDVRVPAVSLPQFSSAVD